MFSRSFILAVVAITFMPGLLLQAKAGPLETSYVLFIDVEVHSMMLLGALREEGAADAMAKTIQDTVNQPLEQKTQEWIDAVNADENGEANYRPFLACYNAAYELGQFAALVQRRLRKLVDEPFRATDAELFIHEKENCEKALKLAQN